MEICDNILDSLENRNIERNNDIYQKVFNDFCEKSGQSIGFTDENASYSNKVINLKQKYIYDSNYVMLFFEILKRNGYFMKQEIKDAIHELGLLENPNENSNIIKKYLNSPIIQDISYDGTSKFTIDSDRYGRFVFEIASFLYRKNKQMKEYIEQNPLPKRCHIHTYFMSQVFPDFYAITSLCEYYFKGRYFHSYTLDSESDKIIDLCSNAVINKDEYYSLFKPRDVSVILNSRVDYEYGIVLEKSNQKVDRCHLLKIALYKEYLRNIGYNGPLENGPSSIYHK